MGRGGDAAADKYKGRAREGVQLGEEEQEAVGGGELPFEGVRVLAVPRSVQVQVEEPSQSLQGKPEISLLVRLA